MSRQKKKKFAENAFRPNIIEPGKDLFGNTKGFWHAHYFLNNNPICLELACGRGEYTIGMARLFPKRNFIGIDLKGDRIWRGSGIAIEENLSNAAFLRAQIQAIEEHFGENEVDEIWIVFPDPRPKDRDDKRRLTHPRFLDMYKNIAKPGAWIRLKTDNTGFYEYSLDILMERNDIKDLQFTEDVYQSEYKEDCHNIVTRYEEKFHTQSNKIKYIKFRFAD